MAMRGRDLLLANGERAPHHEVKRVGHDWLEPRIEYHHELLARAIARFTAAATLGGAPLRRPLPPTILTLAI